MFDMNKVKLDDDLILANGKVVKIDTIWSSCARKYEWSGCLIEKDDTCGVLHFDCWGYPRYKNTKLIDYPDNWMVIGFSPSSKPKSPFFGKKYKITKETCELLQKEVFAAGGCWVYTGTKPVVPFDEITYKRSFLTVDDGGAIEWVCTDHFNTNPLPEGILSVETKLVIDSVIDQKEAKRNELYKSITEHENALIELRKQLQEINQ